MTDAPLSYVDALDAIGLYVERTNGVDLFVNELDDGFLVSFLVGDQQRVASLDMAEVARLQGEARGRGRGSLFRRRDNGPSGERARLRGVGHYLDGKVMAAAIVLQERADGYSIEYTGLVNAKDDLSGFTRDHEEIDDARVRALAK